MYFKLNALKTGLFAIAASSTIFACSKGTNSNSNEYNETTSQDTPSENPPLLTKSNFAYFTNKDSNSISICKINGENGKIEECNTSGDLGLNAPTSSFISNNNFYVANSGSGTLSKCDIDTTSGLISNCAQTGPASVATPSQYTYLSIYKLNDHLYLLNKSKLSIQKYNIDSATGEISENSSEFGLARGGFGFAVAGNYAYITQKGDSYVFIHFFNQQNGDIGGSYNSLGGINGVSNVTSYTPTKTKNSYLYIADESGSNIKRCNFNSGDGSLENCKNFQGYQLGGISSLNDIKFLKNKAYISSSTDKKVSICEVNSNGDLSNCSIQSIERDFENMILKSAE